MTLLNKRILQFVFIGFCVFFFLMFGILESRKVFFDFYIFYTAGSLFNSAQDVYDRDLFRETLYNLAGHRNFPGEWIHYVYPPQATFLFSLVAHFPIKIAHRIALGINSLLLILNLYLTHYSLSQYKSFKTTDLCLILSFLLTGFAYENITNSQLGIFISVFIVAAYIFAQKGKKILAAISLAITSIKPSFLPFFLIYFIVRRQYLTAFYSLIFCGIFTIAPLLITGMPIVSTLTEWFAAMGSWETSGNPNSPDPLGKFSFHVSMIDLEPLVYRIFNGQTSIATLTLKIAIAIILIYCAWLFLKKPDRDKSSLLDFGLISVMAMLFVYHRRYDIFLLFPGLLYIYLHILECDRPQAKKFWTYLLCAVILLISFVDLLFTRLSFTFGSLQSLYLWKLILPLPWSGVITLAALLWLKTQKRFSKTTGENLLITK